MVEAREKELAHVRALLESTETREVINIDIYLQISMVQMNWYKLRGD